MYVSRLSLNNFRNFVELGLDLPTGIVVFYGRNAQGKTTLLEAIYLLAIARAFRAQNEREVINFQTGNEGGDALVGGTIQKRDQRVQVYVGYQSVRSGTEGEPRRLPRSVHKQIRVNRVRRTAAEMVGTLNAVLFSADDIQLVYGHPADRRRYLDVLISQADSVYLRTLQRYQRVVQQRNQLLRLLPDGRAQPDELVFWNQELAREGAWITWRRNEAARALSRSCAEHHEHLVGSEQEMVMEYRPSVPPSDTVEGTEEQFHQALAASSQRERAVSNTQVGPHRDDFDLLLDGVDMGTFASRGQARTLALTLRLAEATYLASARGDGPVVLLDDILSELDSSRQRRVLETATRYDQTLITTTEAEHVGRHLGTGPAYMQVVEGKVYPVRENLELLASSDVPS